MSQADYQTAAAGFGGKWLVFYKTAAACPTASLLLKENVCMLCVRHGTTPDQMTFHFHLFTLATEKSDFSTP